MTSLAIKYRCYGSLQKLTAVCPDLSMRGHAMSNQAKDDLRPEEWPERYGHDAVVGRRVII